MTTRSWQRSWAPRIGHNASVGRGWRARRRAATHIRDMVPRRNPGTAPCLDSLPPPARKESENWKCCIIFASSTCSISVDCQSHLTGVVKQLWLMRVQLVCVLWGIQANVFAPDNLMYIQKRSHEGNKPRSRNWSPDIYWIRYAAPSLPPPSSSPEPRSSVEGRGEEETLYLRAQTTRSQWYRLRLPHPDSNNQGGGCLPSAPVSKATLQQQQKKSQFHLGLWLSIILLFLTWTFADISQEIMYCFFGTQHFLVVF